MKPSTILFKAAEFIDTGKYEWCVGTLYNAIENKGCALGIINLAWVKTAKKSAVKQTVFPNGRNMRYCLASSAAVVAPAAPPEYSQDTWNGAYEAVHALAKQLVLDGVKPGNSDNGTVYGWNDIQTDKRVISRKFRKVARKLLKEGR
jgi:hypothetical protein